ncbi:hypothetical protein FA95DRAFT_1573255 [Auriscalpium vulgare]|uniref:Uncharacterized protein n=1 Tax=Auriscalpium vulgare TaxID=40419 RepID=A0ACB8RPW2_9AGAM|nr:hypothetical protein FA95DRAFT_1573255 [Auriscalpium vulgare]
MTRLTLLALFALTLAALCAAQAGLPACAQTCGTSAGASPAARWPPCTSALRRSAPEDVAAAEGVFADMCPDAPYGCTQGSPCSQQRPCERPVVRWRRVEHRRARRAPAAWSSDSVFLSTASAIAPASTTSARAREPIKFDILNITSHRQQYGGAYNDCGTER